MVQRAAGVLTLATAAGLNTVNSAALDKFHFYF